MHLYGIQVGFRGIEFSNGFFRPDELLGVNATYVLVSLFRSILQRSLNFLLFPLDSYRIGIGKLFSSMCKSHVTFLHGEIFL